jgi:HD superfamily phosphohydrolase
VEEKGIYSIENFLFARRFMYWQVYYHKTSVAAESMLIKILQRAKFLSMNGVKLFATPSLHYFLKNDIDKASFVSNNLALESFVSLDDSDILSTIKVWTATDDKVLSELCRRFVNRQLFRSETTQEPVTEERKRQLVEQYQQHFGISEEDANYFWFEECVSPNTYNYDDEKILILYRDGSLHDITEASDILNVKLLKNAASKYYLCYLKL